MNGSKKISPIGMGVPTRDTEINRKTSISHFDGKIKCVLQKPGKISEILYIDNTIEELSKRVDGQPATLGLGNGLIVIYNKFGKDKCTLGKLKKNLLLDNGLVISGTVLITALDKNNTEMNIRQIQQARTWLLQHTI